MYKDERIEPAQIVIFGAGGDLAVRKLIPALYHLYLDQLLPDRFRIVGLDRLEMNVEACRDKLRKGVETFSDRGIRDNDSWERFAAMLSYETADFTNSASYSRLAELLSEQDRQWNVTASHIFYQATPPMLVAPIVKHLGEAGLASDSGRARIVLEKPFGRDLESARELNRMVSEAFAEAGIYRIDHYLGKETVQNILALRFANLIFEPLWNRNFIDHVQITVAEQQGIEHRGPYYEGAGALRDMIQNHLLQVLCLIAMEAPVSFDADEIRNKKVDVLHAVRSGLQFDGRASAVRGQYNAGWIRGEKVAGYRSEKGVAPDSSTETFAALKLFIDNWRWQDVPFYLRTGKRLPLKASDVLIQFRPVPHRSFPPAAAESWRPNRLAIHIQPDEGASLRCEAKVPGAKVRLGSVGLRFSYRDSFRERSADAYETLLLDVMLGDATLFMRADQVEAAWSVVAPILDAWESAPPEDFPNYAAGTWGPEEAEALIAGDGRSWVQPAGTPASDTNPDES